MSEVLADANNAKQMAIFIKTHAFVTRRIVSQTSTSSGSRWLPDEPIG